MGCFSRRKKYKRRIKDYFWRRCGKFGVGNLIKDSNGVYVYEDKDNLSYELELYDIDCLDFDELSYKNIFYVIENEYVQLVNGRAQTKISSLSDSEIITEYFGNEARGDLNGDGKEDIAFLLTQKSSGSGTFFYLAVALSENIGYKGVNTVFIGDRIAPMNTQIKDREIVVNYADRIKDEPMSAQPTSGVSKYFRILNNELVSIR